MRFLLAIIGYFATATVITLAMGFGYLWHSERLTGDKMFRIIALIQGVDLQQIADSQKTTEGDVPPEEPSREALTGQQQMLDRNFEVKMLTLQQGKQEYLSTLDQLKQKSDRFDRQAREWQDKLKQQEQLTTQENIAKVVSDLEQVKPNVAKDLLMKSIQENRMDDVILLLGKMSESKKSKILKSFSTEEELDKLHEIHRLLIEGAANKEKLSQANADLESLRPTGASKQP
jgi:hypothetical protein